jgi:hypothetical protein
MRRQWNTLLQTRSRVDKPCRRSMAALWIAYIALILGLSYHDALALTQSADRAHSPTTAVDAGTQVQHPVRPACAGASPPALAQRRTASSPES